jgi:hypothetical protein
VITDNLLVASLGQPVNAVLGRNGWDSRTVAGVGLELSPDNSQVLRGQFYMRGHLSVEHGEFQANKLWEQASKDVLVTMHFPQAAEFDFTNESLASDYLSSDVVKINCSREGQEIPESDWPKFGIKQFVMRLIAYLDKQSNKKP